MSVILTIHNGDYMSNLSKQSVKTELNKTFFFEDQLPKVPLPALSVTNQQFIEWCEPLLSKEEFQQTKDALSGLTEKGGLGEKLHSALQEFDAKDNTHSWLDVFWPSRYLGRRDPISLNANFFFLFKHEALTQIERAAKIAAASLNYKLLLDKEEIPVAKLKDTPLSMDQLKYLFSATRIPGAPQDTLRSFYSDETPGPSTARHILVFHKANIYTLDVVSKTGIPHSLDDISTGLTQIIEASSVGRDESSVGHLTTMRRANWAETRVQLQGVSNQNKENFDLIETALFVINLDDVTPDTELAACNDLLHGGSGNRWYDKALELIVFENGWAGINVEHCGLDGTTILNFVDHILDQDSATLDDELGASTQGAPEFSKLTFDLTDELKDTIKDAAETFQNLRQTTICRTFDLSDWGGDHIKSLGMSPDAFVQCAMQLAHQRTKGFIGATYESIATRQYSRGRTEAMRTITPEVCEFVKIMENPATSIEEKIQAFQAAAKKHVGRAKECQQGQAPEQHLWELQNIYNRNPEKFLSNGIMSKIFGGGLSEKTCEEALKFYESPGWVKLRSDSLSTSSAPSPSILYFGFGSTGPGCIGIGYLIRKDVINCYMSTAQGEGEVMEKYIVNFEKALRDLSDLLQSNGD